MVSPGRAVPRDSSGTFSASGLRLGGPFTVEVNASGFEQSSVTDIFLQAGQPFRVTQKTTTMGRSRECDIVVPDANVSRVHAEVRHEGLEYVLVDLGSTNGVEVNGRRVLRHSLHQAT